MNATLAAWKQAAVAAATRFDAKSLRERALMAAAAVALAYAVGDQLWLAPALKAYRTAATREATAQAALDVARTGEQQRHAIDLAQAGALARERDAWRRRVRAGDEALRSHETALVGAEQMVALLERLVAHHGSLRLRRLQSLARTEVGASGAAASAASAVAASARTPRADDASVSATSAGARVAGGSDASTLPQLYRHGVEITLDGSFADLLDYLRALEALPQRLEWSGLVFKVEQYPRAVMTLRLHTLSLDRHWIEL